MFYEPEVRGKVTTNILLVGTTVKQMLHLTRKVLLVALVNKNLFVVEHISTYMYAKVCRSYRMVSVRYAVIVSSQTDNDKITHNV